MRFGTTRSRILAATILGSSIAFIDGSVVNVALPALQSDLNTTVAGAQWVVNAYMLLLSALILVGGAAGDRFGLRRVFVIGLLIFTAASAACGAAPDIGALIAARAAQGLGGALLVPSSLAIISATFPAAERGRAIGIWAGASALTAALGPVLGGWLVDAGSWRLVFFINLPLAAVALWLARRIPEVHGRAQTRLDWQGGVLAAAGLGLLVYGLTRAAAGSWVSPGVLLPIALGISLLGLFIRHEGRTAEPMVPLELFGSRAFTGANLITLFLYFALGGALFFLPFNLIGVQEYTAAEAGASFLPFTLLMAALSPWAGGLASRHGARRPLIVGPAITAAGFALLAVPWIGGRYWTTFFPGMLVLGLGMTISVAPLTTTVMDAVESRFAGAASGINNAVARLAGMLAIAVLGVLAVRVYAGALERDLVRLGLPDGVRSAMLGQVARLTAIRLPRELEESARSTAERIIAESFVSSFRAVMLVAAALSAASALCAVLTIPRGKGS
jgi:EmrB/QacA subfamily drug resistance transporter